MSRSSRFSPYQQHGVKAGFQSAGKPKNPIQGAADFLRAHDRMAVLMPAVARLAAIQNDCAAILPEMFKLCEAIQFEAGQLVLASPNASISAKLKQKLPKLQDALIKKGWQVSAIRLKVQVRQIAPEKVPRVKQISIPTTALSAWEALDSALDDSGRNTELKAAIRELINRRKPGQS